MIPCTSHQRTNPGVVGRIPAQAQGSVSDDGMRETRCGGRSLTAAPAGVNMVGAEVPAAGEQGPTAQWNPREGGSRREGGFQRRPKVP